MADTPQTGQAAPSGGSAQPPDQEQIKQLMDMVTTMAKPHRELSPPDVRPSAKTTGMGTDIGVSLLNMFVPQLGGAVQKHAMLQKQAQINEAYNDFKQLHDAYEEAWMMSGGDQKKADELWQQMPGYKDIFDPNNPAAKKKLKNYAKVFQVDPLNPEKTHANAAYQGLQKFMEAYPKSKAMKAAFGKIQGAAAGAAGAPPGAGMGAASGAGMAAGATGQATGAQPPQQPQGQPPQQPPQQAGGAPGQMPPTGGLQMPSHMAANPQALENVLRLAQGRYELKSSAQGEPFAFDTHTGQTHTVKVYDPNSGEEFTPTMAGRARMGTIASVNGIPIGINGITADGQFGIKHRGDTNWTPADEKTFAAGEAAWTKGEEQKIKRANQVNDSRALSWAKTRLYDAYDSDSNTFTKISAFDKIQHPDRYAPPGLAQQVLNRVALFREIENSGVKFMNDAIDKMGDAPWPEAVREKILLALRSTDPESYWKELIKSNVLDTMTDAQTDYVSAIVSLDESAMSLRSLGGLGQGSDQLRNAIFAMVPGAGTPSAKYARRQMMLFENEVKQLKSSLPGLGKKQPEELGNPEGGVKLKPNF